MRDGIRFSQLEAAVFVAMTVPLTLVGARLHWRWVLVAVLCAAAYYYIMYRTSDEKTLAEQTLSAYGKGGRVLLGLVCVWFIWLCGWLSDRSALVFVQTQTTPYTGLLLLALAAWTAKHGIRAVVRCGAVLLPLVLLLEGVVLVGSAPGVKTEWLAPFGDLRQGLLFLPLLTVPTVARYYKTTRNKTDRPALWLLTGGILALAASVITAGCLSPHIAAEQMSFYTLAQSVSLFGTVERFEALISAACLVGYFLLCALLLCTVRELLSMLLPKLPEQKIWLYPPAALAAIISGALPLWIFALGAAIFCGIFPVLTQGIVALKKDGKNTEKTRKSC